MAHRKAARFVEDNKLLGEMNNLDRLRQHRRLVPGHQTIKSSNGKRFPGPYSYSFHYFSGFPMVDLVMILGHNLKRKKFNGTWALFYAWLLEQFDVDHRILDNCQSGD